MKIPNRQIDEIVNDLTWLWEETTGDPSICIAIIDGNINQKHPALAGADITTIETYTGGQAGGDGLAASHGTHIASIIFGQHGSEVKGIAPKCKGINLPVFQDDPEGRIQPCSQLDLARAIMLAANAGAQIINISGGELSDSGVAHPLLSQAIQHCFDRNILIVAAAGNDGCDCMHIPAASSSVLVVGGMDTNGNPLSFSNWGAAYWSHGILAPGDNILGADNKSGVLPKTGTSFAAPVVSGIAALLLSAQVKQGVKTDPLLVRQALLEGADGCITPDGIDCQRLLRGRINPKKTYLIMDSIVNLKKEPNMELQTPTQFSAQSSEALQVPTANEPATQGISPSCKGDSSCSCGSKEPEQMEQKVFALGTLGYDLVSEARRDSIIQHFTNGNPSDPKNFLEYLSSNPWEAASVTWTLNLNATPIYAIIPDGPFAANGYKILQDFLNAQINEGSDRISVPGFIVGKMRLMSGQVVPAIVPELRAMYNWNTKTLLETVLGPVPDQGAKPNEKLGYEQRHSAVRNFLERVYYELQNLGISPQDRAINYAATNALNTALIFADALKDDMQLDNIEAERSSICRQDSDCWDVLLTFFDPEKQLTRARKLYRFTVDVSDVCPVMVGAVRSWSVR